MATTNSGFIRATVGGVVSVIAAARSTVDAVATALSGTRIDTRVNDLGLAGYALNGAVRVTLSGTTVKTIDLTNTTTGAASYAGDTAFAKFSQLRFYNDGAASVTVATGGTNGATFASSVVVAAGDTHVFTFSSAVTVDSTHKTLDITPTSGGSFILLVGGQ